MKKLIYSTAFIALIGSTVLVACDKQNATSKKTAVDIKAPLNLEKELFTDLQLIEIINGINPSYTKIEEIEEVLFDNCKLSSTVLRTLIGEARFPDYIVEEMMILSSPSSADITYLSATRPALGTATIISASNIDLKTSLFAVDNTNPRKIFIAKNLKQKSLCTDGCGESEWNGEDFKILDLTSSTPPLDPAQMKPCNAGKWVCGRSIETRIVLISEGVYTVYTRCKQNEERCVRKASRFRD